MSLIIEEELNSLIIQVDNILSKPFLVYDVQFGDFKFRFEHPVTKEEALEFKAKKKEFLTLIFADALKNLVKDLVYTPDGIGLDSPWKIIDMFLVTNLAPEDVVSEQSAEDLRALKEKAAKDAKEGTNKIPLNLDSVYVNQQREGWTDEDQEELIRRNNDVD